MAPTFTWNWRWQEIIYDALAEVTTGKRRKLLITLPPQHGKTNLVTVRYPVWRMIRTPGLRVGLGAYNQTYANRLSRQARRVARDANGRLGEKNAANEWELKNESSLYAVGVGAGITGRSIDLMVIDDPVKSREEADSEAHREAVWEWYLDDVTTRLQETGAIILVMTPWHQDDLAGRIQASEDWPNWGHVRLPAIAEANDPIGRNVGQALCPERFTLKMLKERQQILGEGFESLYQQNPVPRGGLFFKRDWFTMVDAVPDGHTKRRVRYWDLAACVRDTNAYTSGVLMCKTGAAGEEKYYVEHVVRVRMTPADRNDMILKTAELDALLPGFERTWFEEQPGAAGIETSTALVRKLAGYPVRSDRVTGSKQNRAEPLADAARGGLIRLVKGGWNAAFLSELASFPRGAFMDQCLPAGTLIWVRRGLVPVESVVVGDEAMTREGWCRVNAVGQTSPSSDTVAIEYNNGCVVECTHAHPVFVAGRGFSPASGVRVGDEGLECLSLWKHLNGVGPFGGGIQMPSNGTVGFTSWGICGRGPDIRERVPRPFTGRSTNPFTGLSPVDSRFTTETGIRSTTPLRIWNALPLASIDAVRRNSGRSRHPGFAPTLIPFEGRQLSGTAVKPGESGTLRTGSGSWRGEPPSIWSASSAARNSGANTVTPSIAALSATKQADLNDLTFTPLRVNGAKSYSTPTSRLSGFAPTRVVAVRGGRRDVPVFNLAVDGCPEYFANGILVHNCDSSSGAFNKLARGGLYVAVANV